MSAASVLFVLEHLLSTTSAAGQEWGRALLTALGPGFSAGFAVLAYWICRSGLTVTIFHAVLALVLLQRSRELLLAHANTARLLGLGAAEVDRAGYKWFVGLRAGRLAALALAVPAATSPHWPLLALFFLLQAGRVWVIANLGRCWTTRLIVVPGAALVTSGPYRLFRHPNYLIVLGEVAIFPLACSAPAIAVGFSACNGIALAPDPLGACGAGSPLH